MILTLKALYSKAGTIVSTPLTWTLQIAVLLLLTAISIKQAEGSQRADACRKALMPDSDYTIQVDDFYLDPINFRVKHGGKEALLGKLSYLALEEIVLSAKYVRHEEISESRSDSESESTTDLHTNYGINLIKRIRKNLKTKFGEEVSDRIISFYGRGYAWASKPKPEEVILNKIWQRTDRPYLMWGDKIINIHKKQEVLLRAFISRNCRPIQYGEINLIFENNDIPITPNFSEVQGAMYKLNAELRSLMGINENLVSSAQYGSQTMQINPKFLSDCLP